MRTILTFLLIFCQIIPVSLLNVLVWTTTIGRSHVAFMGGLADIISQEGHNVTMLLLKNDPDVDITGTKHVNKVLRFESPLIASNEWSYFNFKQSDIFYTKTIDMGDFFKMQSVNSRICKSLLEADEFLEQLKCSKFDIAIVEFFHFCPAAILEQIGVKKVILATALGMTHAHYELLNLQVPLSYVPVQMTHMGTEMTFFGRLYNIAFYYASKFCYNYILWQDQRMVREKYGANYPDLEALYRSKIDYIFTNTNEFTESTRPTLPMVKYIGGSTTPTPSRLDDDFESILARPSKGTILFSLGSLLKSETMPDFIRIAFLDAFKQLPDYTFIWKTTSNNNFTYPNIFYRDWVPQVDLLADRRLKVFITHSGMNSVQESLLFGVPLITMPVFADQDSNAVIAQERGYAYGLNKFSITKDDVLKAISEVIGIEGRESPYTLKARQTSMIMQGGWKGIRSDISRFVQISGSTGQLTHLHLNTAHLNVIQYYNLDIYIFVSLCIMSILYLVSLIHSPYYYFRVRIRMQKDKCV